MIAFARGYKRPYDEALIAAGYLTTDDIGEGRPIEIGSSSSDLTADELLAEISLRIQDRGPRTPSHEVDNVDRILDDLGSTGGDGRLKKRGKGA